MSLFSIASPCPQKIAGMTAATNGFYCASCAKTVVDFREKTNAEILDTIRLNSSGDICGILKTSQGSERKNFGFHVVRFAAALVLVFGSLLFQSCEDQARVGKLCDTSAAGRQKDSLAQEDMMQSAKSDSIRVADSLMRIDSSK